MMNRLLIEVLTKRIIDESRKKIKGESHAQRNLLMQRKDLWTTKHYQLVADMMQWNVNSVKRLFGLPGYEQPKSLSKNSERIICQFLNAKSWDQLEKSLVNELLNDGKNDSILSSFVSRMNIIDEKIEELRGEFQSLKRLIVAELEQSVTNNIYKEITKMNNYHKINK